MPLERIKLKCIEPKDNNKKKNKYGFSFSKNQKTASIFTTDHDVYEKFKKELMKYCILMTFQEDYEIEKLIGKGSFGKVCLIVCNYIR